MKKIIMWGLPVFLILGVLGPEARAQGGLFVGLHGGWSAQKPSLRDVSFNTDTTFVYGLRAGVKFMMIALEVNYLQAAHNLDVREGLTFGWAEREVDYTYLGLNLKYYFPVLFVHPYVSAGYGNYTADIENVDKDTDKGFNVGLGVELHLGGKFSLLAEGRYHRVKVDIQDRELTLGDFTLNGGINIYF